MERKMTKNHQDLYITLSVEGSDSIELDELTRELKQEIENLEVETVKPLSAESLPRGAKSADWAIIGQMVVTLAPTVIPPFFELVKSWIERKPSTPVKVRIKVGKKTAQIEYDPTKTTAKDLDILIKSLSKSVKK
jgi:hypothetical protein